VGARAKPRRLRATYTRPHGVRQLLCALDVGDDLFSADHTERKTRVEFLAFCNQTRSRYPAETRLAFILDNFTVHKGDEVRARAEINNVELAYTPQYASWLNRIEPQSKGLRYFCLDGTDHPDHQTQARLIAGSTGATSTATTRNSAISPAGASPVKPPEQNRQTLAVTSLANSDMRSSTRLTARTAARARPRLCQLLVNLLVAGCRNSRCPSGRVLDPEAQLKYFGQPTELS
jgi:hypothetical protein